MALVKLSPSFSQNKLGKFLKVFLKKIVPLLEYEVVLQKQQEILECNLLKKIPKIWCLCAILNFEADFRCHHFLKHLIDIYHNNAKVIFKKQNLLSSKYSMGAIRRVCEGAHLSSSCSKSAWCQASTRPTPMSCAILAIHRTEGRMNGQVWTWLTQTTILTGMEQAGPAPSRKVP